ncbi:MAG TPA: DUF4157 domain-containing protein, partial [Kofleriaceae bacterium]|nr:DUF4157 domain-containing protein [Kofleriaceae bacterium]
MSRRGDATERDAHQRAEEALAAPAGGRRAPGTCCECGGPSCKGHGAAAARAAVPPGAGQELPRPLRLDLEGRFGASFEDVRIHTGPDASARAARLGARAFTVGSDIVFGEGAWAPDSGPGRRLLAHELAHVAQGPDGPPIRRYDDPELAREMEEERGILEGPISFESIATMSLEASVTGPLRPGEVVDDHGLVVTQHSATSTTIELGDQRIEIRAADEGERYAFWIEPLAPPRAAEGGPSLLGEPSGLIQLQLAPPARRVQRAVRIAATTGVRIDTPTYDDALDRPELVALVRRVARAEQVDPMTELTVGPWVREVPLDGGAVQLELDDTRIRISPPGSERGFQVGVFSAPRFAYWIDPEWTGPNRDERQVFIVASPGIRVEQGERPFPLAVRDYGRKLVPVLLRVPHPSMVPEQGEEIDPSDYIGARPLRGDEPIDLFGGPPAPPRAQALAGLSGGVTITHESGALVAIRPVAPERGAAFAYQVLPGPDTEIRIVVGPDTFVEVVEPRSEEGLPDVFQEEGEGFRQAGLRIDIVEVSSAEAVPPQGLPLNLDFYAGYGRYRRPDRHR